MPSNAPVFLPHERGVNVQFHSRTSSGFNLAEGERQSPEMSTGFNTLPPVAAYFFLLAKLDFRIEFIEFKKERERERNRSQTHQTHKVYTLLAAHT